MATRLPASLVPPGSIDDCLERARRKASALEEIIGDIIIGIRDGTIVLPPGLRERIIPREPIEPIRVIERPRKWSDPIYEKLAKPGVMELKIAPHDKKHCLVAINRAAAQPVPIGQAEFLRAIASPDGGTAGTPSDDFVPWKCKAAIARERGCSPHAIDVMVGRLRERLWCDFKVSPLLVESEAAHVRFRLRVARSDSV